MPIDKIAIYKNGYYSDLLDEDYAQEIQCACISPKSKMQYLGYRIFDFTTYDGELDTYLAEKMIAVLRAIINRSTFAYIESSRNNYINYIMMCNTPFLHDKLEWGTSIRGAWFDDSIDTFEIPCTDIVVKSGQLTQFMKELIEWAGEGVGVSLNHKL
jgi:hypothetical protein